MDSVGFWTAEAGKTLLVVNMTIENCGYDEFYVNPSNFRVVDNVVYSHSITTYFLDDVGYIPMQPVYVLDGGKIVCAISFEIPKGYQSVSLRHRGAMQFKIEWVSAYGDADRDGLTDDEERNIWYKSCNLIQMMTA
ncbi:MAG: DUF4352 domain-containing protein [Nitrososphaerales archaeon]